MSVGAYQAVSDCLPFFSENLFSLFHKVTTICDAILYVYSCNGWIEVNCL